MASLVLALALELEEMRNHESAVLTYAAGVTANLYDRIDRGLPRVIYEGPPDLLQRLRDEIRKPAPTEGVISEFPDDRT